MRKTVLVLMVLMLASPALARLDIDCSVNGCVVTVSWDASSEPNKVRAFALDIIADNDVNITAVNDVNGYYNIHPGSFGLDGNGVPTGSAVCSSSYSGTGPGLDSNWVTVEMGSLYYPTGDSSPNAPPSSGVLLTFTVEGNCNVLIRENAIRAGVVLTSGAEVPSGDFNSPGCAVSGCDAGCWTVTECAGQQYGDATCDGKVNLDDLWELKEAFGTTVGGTHGKGLGQYDCCTDFNHDGKVNLDDLWELKQGFGTTGYIYTSNTSCP